MRGSWKSEKQPNHAGRDWQRMPALKKKKKKVLLTVLTLLFLVLSEFPPTDVCVEDTVKHLATIKTPWLYKKQFD